MTKTKSKKIEETFEHFNQALTIGGDFSEDVQAQFDDLEKIGNRFNVVRSIDDTLERYSGKVQTALNQNHKDKKDGSKPIYANYFIVPNGKHFNLSMDDTIMKTGNKAWKGIKSDNFIKFYDSKPKAVVFGEASSDNVLATLQLHTSKTSGNVYGYLKKGRNIPIEIEGCVVCMSEKKDDAGSWYSWLMLPDFHQIPYTER
jgi:hypothetical protein